MMAELKKHCSLDTQVNKLTARGLIIDDEAVAKQFLFDSNYYRVTGYLHDFKVPGNDHYIDGVTLSQIMDIYEFDRRFARLMMYVLENVEETLKARFSYLITEAFPDDPLIYLNPKIFKEYTPYIDFLKHFYTEKDNNSKLPFVKHHQDCYGGFMPMWAAIELFTMGNLDAFYSNLLPVFQKKIARSYNTGPTQLSNWIHNLTITRNHIAHYMRIYNFHFGRTPKKCSNHPKYSGSSSMIFDQLYIAAQLFSGADNWNHYVLPEFCELFNTYSGKINLTAIGFPPDWEVVLSL